MLIWWYCESGGSKISRQTCINKTKGPENLYLLADLVLISFPLPLCCAHVGFLLYNTPLFYRFMSMNKHWQTDIDEPMNRTELQVIQEIQVPFLFRYNIPCQGSDNLLITYISNFFHIYQKEGFFFNIFGGGC